jgi:hypothetical protein
MKVDTELERQQLQGAFEALCSAIWLCSGCGFSADAWPIVEMQEDCTVVCWCCSALALEVSEAEVFPQQPAKFLFCHEPMSE